MVVSQRPPDGRPRARRWTRPGWRVVITAVLGAISIGLLLLVAPPGEVVEEISHMNPVWLLVAILLEVVSCTSYVVVFRRFFPEPPRAVSRRVAWISMGVGAVLPGGNISSAAATGLLLRSHGVPVRQLVERCAALLCLLTGLGFLVNGIAAVALLAGLPGGPHDLEHTGGPILVSVGVLGAAALVVALARRYRRRTPKLIRGVAAGLEGAWRETRFANRRLLGAVGYLCLDMGALWAACGATGHPLGFPAVAIAYCIGYLATLIPMPAGVGVLDSGLAGALVLYGFSPVAAVGAVLVYHAVAIWVPGLGGLIAWVPTRGRRAAAAPADPPPAEAAPAEAALAEAALIDRPVLPEPTELRNLA